MPENLIWPSVFCVAVIFVGVAALFILRPALLRLIDRTSKVGKEGASFDRTQESGKSPPVLSFDALMRSPISASVLDRETNIISQLDGYALRSEEEKTKILVRALANARVTLEHNSVAHVIFGSQLRLLVSLNAVGSGLPIDEIQKHYSEARAAYPEVHANSSFDDWIRFLISQNLVVRKDHHYEITLFGSDFLKYLIDARLTHERKG